MMQEPDSNRFKNLAHLRLSSRGFLLGAALVIMGTLFLPVGGDPGDVQAMQQIYGENEIRLQACALLIVFGFWTLAAAYSELQQSITENGAAWARIGLILHIIGVAVWTVGMSLDISYPAAIVNWLSAPLGEVANAHSVVTALSPEGFGRGLFPMNVMINWLAFACLGIALLRSRFYSVWIGWYGLIIGLSGWLLGIAMTFTGREAIVEGFIALFALTIIWWMILGIVVARSIRSIHHNPVITERKSVILSENVTNDGTYSSY
jgi:hypothetical protein